MRVVGVFPTVHQAESAIRALRATGCDPARIGVVAADQRTADALALRYGLDSTPGPLTARMVANTTGVTVTVIADGRERAAEALLSAQDPEEIRVVGTAVNSPAPARHRCHAPTIKPELLEVVRSR